MQEVTGSNPVAPTNAPHLLIMFLLSLALVAELSASTGTSVKPIEFLQKTPPGSIHGVKWQDDNGNGQRDPGEPGLPGVTIYLDTNNDNTLDRGEPSAVAMENDPNTAFDEAGRYWLTDVAPGVYTVREVVPDGFVQTFPSPAGSGSHSVTVGSGAVIEGIDFGNQQIVPGSIHGVKWLDENGNSQRDSGEPGLPGVTIYLDTNNDNILDEGEPHAVAIADDPNTAFDEAGLYWLSDVAPGVYTVREVVPDGFVQTFPLPVGSGSHSVTVGSGFIISDIDFGNTEFSPNYDVKPDPLDMFIDARDLVEWFQRIRKGEEPGFLLFDFSRFWESQP